jgi:hypothetical protein
VLNKKVLFSIACYFEILHCITKCAIYPGNEVSNQVILE